LPRRPAQPAPTGSAILADRIRDRILATGLAEGDHFMTEQELAAQYNTSRRVTREAVGRLRALGLLRARRRKGLEVARPDPVGLMGQSVQAYGRSPGDLHRLAQLRYSLELGAVDLAVQFATDQQIEQLTDLAQRFAQIKPPVEFRSAKFDRLGELDYAFHRVILESTGNELIAGFHRVILDYFEARRRGEDPSARDVNLDLVESGWQHLTIARAFARRDAITVHAMLREHLQSIRQAPIPSSPGTSAT
jgi:DNA-binding FadR family transcriptional regulator